MGYPRKKSSSCWITKALIMQLSARNLSVSLVKSAWVPTSGRSSGKSLTQLVQPRREGFSDGPKRLQGSKPRAKLAVVHHASFFSKR